MKTVRIRWKKSTAAFCLFIFACSLLVSAGYSQEQSNQARRQFYNLEELIKIIDRARESGMSDE
ncbi:MAG: hypothetical protein ABIK68_07715, partial [bacterium]